MVIEVEEGSRKINAIDEAVKTSSRRGTPVWLEVDASNFRCTVKALPNREDLPPTIQEQFIVEFYSR